MNKLIIFSISLICLVTKPVHGQFSDFALKVAEISEYIASPGFSEYYKSINHVDLVDTIYIKALTICDNEKDLTLGALIFALLPVNSATVKIPLLPVRIEIPFFSASEPIFSLKNENLPRYLFSDSPTSKNGDIDKLAHFFGSAYLEYSSFLLNSARFLGHFIEAFEDFFKVDSYISHRDLKVNELGIKFGRELKCNKDALPSVYLKYYR